MRHYPLCVIAFILCGFSFVADARVGESRSEMEKRFFQNRRLIEYPARYLERKINSTRGGRMPYSSHLIHFPAECEHALYFKKAQDATVSRSDLDETPQPDGWDLHVVFYQKISVFEAYRRIGGSINEAEITALLGLNRGNSFWKRAERPPASENGPIWVPTYVLEDGTMAATQMGGSVLIFYRPEFEQIIRERVLFEREREREEQTRYAPESVLGF